MLHQELQRGRRPATESRRCSQARERWLARSSSRARPHTGSGSPQVFALSQRKSSRDVLRSLNASASLAKLY